MPDDQGNMTASESASLHAFFAPIAPVLELFAATHNMQITKYYHDSASWRMDFRHPQGGVAAIHVSRISDAALSVDGTWWVDDYDARTRSLRRLRAVPLDAGSPTLADALESALEQELSWEQGEWDQVAGGYDDWQQTWSAADFEALNNRFPVLKAASLP
jgi:hypothetical protein